VTVVGGQMSQKLDGRRRAGPVSLISVPREAPPGTWRHLIFGAVRPGAYAWRRVG
jgi:hypothetical protein